MAAECWRRAARRDAIGLPPTKAGNPLPTASSSARGNLFPREARLVRRGEFDAVYRAGKRRSSSHYTVFFRANELPQSRFGFSIKKALGGAVVRNRIRRRLREVVRCHRLEIPAGWDIVIHPKSMAARAPFLALTSDLLRLLKGL
ncbi:MAG: ribonuclease P protein component [Acidobacteria bacterium]|nr:MAG: ribonuclease P protein component [Acidobacteriota bacterium]